MRQWKMVLSAFCMTVSLIFLAGCADGNGADSKEIAENATGSKETTENAADLKETTENATGSKEVMENAADSKEISENGTMKITVGDTVFTVSLADNSSVQVLKELLAKEPLTIDMHDYGEMEKVGPIGTDLPRNDEQISTGPGDVILYQGNSLVIYYDTNSWDFTRIGKINDVAQEELKEALGEGDVTVTFSLLFTA